MSYAAWPDTLAVGAKLAAAGFTLRPSADVRAVILAVTAEIEQATNQKFVADTVDATRVFDGSGTAELEIDPIVSLTDVRIVGYQSDPGYTLSAVRVVQQQNRPQTKLIIAQGSVPGFSADGALSAYDLIFPDGRQNVYVTGKWGYGGEIPPDLWLAVLGEIAHRLGSESIFTPDGRISMWREGDEETRYDLGSTDAMSWHGDYLTAIKNYRRSAGKRLRQMRNRMI